MRIKEHPPWPALDCLGHSKKWLPSRAEKRFRLHVSSLPRTMPAPRFFCIYTLIRIWAPLFGFAPSPTWISRPKPEGPAFIRPGRGPTSRILPSPSQLLHSSNSMAALIRSLGTLNWHAHLNVCFLWMTLSPQNALLWSGAIILLPLLGLVLPMCVPYLLFDDRAAICQPSHFLDYQIPSLVNYLVYGYSSWSCLLLAGTVTVQKSLSILFGGQNSASTTANSLQSNTTRQRKWSCSWLTSVSDYICWFCVCFDTLRFVLGIDVCDVHFYVSDASALRLAAKCCLARRWFC